MNMSSLVTHNYDVIQQLLISNDTINTACGRTGAPGDSFNNQLPKDKGIYKQTSVTQIMGYNKSSIFLHLLETDKIVVQLS